MFIYLVIGGVIIFVAAIACMILMRVIDRKFKYVEKEPEEKKDKTDWSNLAQSYNVTTGNDTTFSGSDAYTVCKQIYDKVKKQVSEFSRRPLIKLKAASPDDVRNFNAVMFVKKSIDSEEARELYEASVAMRNLFEMCQKELDAACVSAHECRDESEKRECINLLDKAFELIDPNVRLYVFYVDPSTKSRTAKTYNVDRGLLSSMCGMPELKPFLSPSKRRQLMDADGYRCRRCGRSALVGASLRVSKNPTEGFVTLCDHCKL